MHNVFQQWPILYYVLYSKAGVLRSSIGQVLSKPRLAAAQRRNYLQQAGPADTQTTQSPLGKQPLADELGIVQNPSQFPLYLCPKLWSSQWIQRTVHSFSPVPCGYTLYILISFDLGKHCFVEATPWQVLISSASDRRQNSQGKFFCRLFWILFLFFIFFYWWDW